MRGWYWYLLLSLALIYLPLLFPDGRLLSRRWLPVAVLAGIGTLGMALLGMLTDTLRGTMVDYRIDLAVVALPTATTRCRPTLPVAPKIAILILIYPPSTTVY